MPQFVEIPAPVTTNIFLDLASVSAISCSSASHFDVTFVVGIVTFAPLRRLAACTAVVCSKLKASGQTRDGVGRAVCSYSVPGSRCQTMITYRPSLWKLAFVSYYRDSRVTLPVTLL
jgi:hypothetical protein